MSKPAAGLLFGLSSEGDSKASEPSDSRAEAKLSAAAAALKAFKANDKTALSEALSAHYDACAMAGPEGSEPDEDD